MWIIGCDYHPRFQQIAWVNTEGGECGERRLEHMEQAEQFYRSLAGQAVRVGMEASGHARWFERLLAELGYELWIGNPAAIRAAEPRKQKTDARDAEHSVAVAVEGQFETLRIWVPTAAERDVRQLVLHRHRLVGMRTRVKNQLRAVALNEGMGRKPGLWSQPGTGAVAGSGIAGMDSSAAPGQPGTAGGVGAAHRSAGPGGGAGGGAAARGDAVADASRSRSDHGLNLRADHRRSGALWVRQAGGQLSRSDSGGEQLGRAATAGAHHQARQRTAALLAGGGGARRGPARARTGTLLSSAGDAQEPLHRRRRRGPQVGGTVVVDVDSRTELWATPRVRFACRVTRFRPWGGVHPRRK